MTDVKVELKEKFQIEVETIPEEVVPVITKVVESYKSLESEKNGLTTKLSSESDKVKELISSRDGLKAEIGVLRKELVNKPSVGNEELQKAFNTEKERADKLESDLASTKSEFEKVSNSFNSLNKTVRDSLLSQLPENSEARKFAEGISETQKLEEFIKISKKDNPDLDGNRGGSGSVKIVDGKKFDEYSLKELEAMEKSKPEVYNKLFKEKYGN